MVTLILFDESDIRREKAAGQEIFQITCNYEF